MKQLSTFLGGLFLGVIFTLVTCLTLLKANSPENVRATGSGAGDLTPDQGVIISTDECSGLQNAYRNLYPGNNDLKNGLFGGRIGKTALQKILAGMSSTQMYVNFRFGYKTVPGSPVEQYVLMLSSFPMNGTQNAGQLIIRNGGDSESFCPTKCN